MSPRVGGSGKTWDEGVSGAERGARCENNLLISGWRINGISHSMRIYCRANDNTSTHASELNDYLRKLQPCLQGSFYGCTDLVRSKSDEKDFGYLARVIPFRSGPICLSSPLRRPGPSGFRGRTILPTPPYARANPPPASRPAVSPPVAHGPRAGTGRSYRRR